MLCALGDLVEDVVIRVDDPVNVASDTHALIERRRGGSAANVAAAAAELAGTARFVGQVGDDPIGSALIEELRSVGVQTAFVRQSGRTGTIAVLVDATGERTMLTDRGACSELDRPEPEWLDGVTVLHVPMYSLVGDPLAGTARSVMADARGRGIPVSVDVSSMSLIESLGRGVVLDLLATSRPDVLFANAAEASLLGVDGPVAGALTIVKRGPEPAVVYIGPERFEVPATLVDRADDTTGAGDVFAAGVLTSSWRDDPAAAIRAGHDASAAMLGR